MGNLRQLRPGAWCGVIGGRAITINEVAGVWLVYINHVLQEYSARFRTAEAAYQWVCVETGIAGERHPVLSTDARAARPQIIPKHEKSKKIIANGSSASEWRRQRSVSI